jgi:hypothetical protein
MKREMRFAIRMLLKQPGFSSLALGIGATSAAFSLIQGVLLTPPPYKKPQQLVLVLFSMKPFHSAVACRWDRGLVVLAYQTAVG